MNIKLSLKHILFFAAGIAVFTSCNSRFVVAKKRYSAGYYIRSTGTADLKDTKGLSVSSADTTIEIYNANNDSVQEGQIPSSSVTTFNVEADVGYVVPGYIVDDTLKRVSTGFATNTKTAFPTGEQSDEPADDEQKNMRRASILSLACYLLMFFSLISLLFSPIVFAVLTTLMLACGIGALIFSRRVRSKHGKKEKYPGRLKMTFAIIVGIVAIAFAFLAAVVAIGSS